MQQTTFERRVRRSFEKHPVTTILLTLNLIMGLVLMIFSRNILTFNSQTLIDFGAIVPKLITDNKEYYRLFTSMFLHGGLFHLLMNSYFLYIIGGFVEDLFGKPKYILIYFISGLGSSALVWVTDMQSMTPTIGASGALFGIMGALFLLTYQKPLLFTPQGIRSIRTLVLINAVFTILGANISVYGHAGGFITGMLLMFLFLPGTRGPSKPKDEHHTHHGKYVIDADDVSDDDIYYKDYRN